jgi:photosystem II stability/assembly factor-like uncharacterized protein
MASTKARSPKVPQAPQRKHAGPPLGRRWLPLLVGAAIVLAAVAAFVVARGGSSDGGKTAGLPHTSDYHSLLVSPTDPRQLILGTHQGLFRSTDAGRHWRNYRMGGRDAMNLVRPAGGGTVWLAGHNVFARSDDGGQTWKTLAPRTLPSLDLHGFTVDPKTPSTLYAAVAGEGLYRSTNGGRSFSALSKDVGGAVMAMAVTPGDDILAGDMQRGLLVSHDKGATWSQSLRAQLAGLAINPTNPLTILATGPGILRSTDGGKHWSVVARISAGAGPVAWSPASPRVAYVVGFDRMLYRSSDSGATWTQVR